MKNNVKNMVVNKYSFSLEKKTKKNYLRSKIIFTIFVVTVLALLI